MCSAIDEMREESMQIGEKRGEQKGRQIGEKIGAVQMCRSFGISVSEAVRRIAEQFQISEAESEKIVRKYWQ